MKKIKKQNKVITYGFANYELHQQLKAAGHKVVPNKKRQADKRACRRKEKACYK